MTGLIMKYFVLKPGGTNIYAAASREALRAYAEYISHVNPEFAADLTNWAEKEQIEADRIINFQSNLDMEDD